MSKKILIVDDSATARMVISRCVEMGVSNETEIILAEHGEDALEKLNDNIVDLIITDINMPVMDGEEFIIKLNKSEELSKIPIIVVSSVASPTLEVILTTHGVNTVVSKPVSPMIIADAIKALEIDGFEVD
ncbi:response regulator [candidate division KSB1 bacterium]